MIRNTFGTQKKDLNIGRLQGLRLEELQREKQRNLENSTLNIPV